ncbi:tetratricopeptide repeat protein [bacterium]|nr:tetratricopeptide repeat protein [bacterium]
MKFKAMIYILLLNAVISIRAQSVNVYSVQGDVKVRRGMSELWNPVRAGSSLGVFDTILSGEGASVVLELEDGTTFKMDHMTILDIADLRRITERELFVYLMSEKVRNLPAGSGSKLQITRVTVVRADDKSQSKTPEIRDSFDKEMFEINGAIALLDQNFITNAAMKLHRIIKHYDSSERIYKSYYYLGQAHEAINQPGRAIEAYRHSIKMCGKYSYSAEVKAAKEAVERLQVDM